MAGYSGTPLLQKLGIKPGHRVSTVNAPTEFDKELGPLPEGATYVGATAKNVGVIVCFVKSQANYQKQLPALANRIKADGIIWIGWPKKPPAWRLM
jgi:hypothetical protein